MSYEIFANHAHVSPPEIKPKGTVAELKKLMDACGIARAVCFAVFPLRYAEAGLPGNPNRWLAGEIANDSSLVGFGTIDLTKPNITEQVEEAAALGFQGLKLHPAHQEFHVLSEPAREIYAAAERLGLFVSFHTGMHWHRLREYQPVLFDELNWDYPNLKFSMEHIGGYHFFREALAVLSNGKNGYAGWTSLEGGGANETGAGAWSLTDAELCTVVRQIGPERSIFGLDFPYKNTEMINSAIARFSALPIAEEAKTGLFGGNLARALGVACK
ncbi:MAG: amidohydrolase family protein [Oscillospiraceae bacterium]|nr:amidohydrolase family protein [Oscillospiraceae bacterium]